MKRNKKLLTLLPLLALLLSACDFQIIPEDAPSDWSDQLEEDTRKDSENSGSDTGSGSGEGGDSGSDSGSGEGGDSGFGEGGDSGSGEGGDSGSGSGEGGEGGDSGSGSGEGGDSGSGSGSGEGGGSSSGGDDEGTSDVPSASATAYEVKIVNEEPSLAIGSKMDIYVKLYTYTYTEGVADPEVSVVDASASDVSLTASSQAVSILEGQLAIYGEEVGQATITAHWQIDDYTYDSNEFEVSVYDNYEPSYSYKVEITNASEIAEIETGDTVLVEVTLYVYLDDNTEPLYSRVATTSDATDITLNVSDSSVLGVTQGSLAIEALSEGYSSLSATWGSYGTSFDVTIHVTYTPEVPVLTYALEIENKNELQNISVGYGHEDDDAPILKIALITYSTTSEGVETIRDYATSSTGLDISVSNSSYVSVNNDLSLNISVTEDEDVSISVCWPSHYVDESNVTLASDSVDMKITYEVRQPVLVESIKFSQSEYVMSLGDEEGATRSLAVNVEISPNEVDDDSYTISVADSSVAEYDDATHTLNAKAVGNTTMTVIANDGGGAADIADIRVTQGATNLQSISLSKESIELSYDGQYGSFTLGISEDEYDPDVNVTLNPSNPDYRQLAVNEVSNNYLVISQETTNHFVISVNENAFELLADSVLYTTLQVSSTQYTNVSPASLNVIIDMLPQEVGHPVQGISLTGDVSDLGDGYETSIAYNGSFTLGGLGSSIVVSILPSTAYDTNWTASINQEANYASLITLEGNSITGYKVSPLNGVDLTEDAIAKIDITSSGVDVNGSKLITTLTINIIHQEAYPVSLSLDNEDVSMLTSSIETISINPTITDQRGNTLVADYQVKLDNLEAANEGEEFSLTLNDNDNGTYTLTSGSICGSADVVVFASGYEEVKDSFKITVNQQYYGVESIKYDGETDITLTYKIEETGEVTGRESITIAENLVSYYSSFGPVDPSYYGFYLESSDTTHININDKTITALNATGEDPVVVKIVSTYNNDAYVSLYVTVKDQTDYTPQQLIVSNAENLAIYENSATTLAELGVSVEILPSYATNKDYGIYSSSDLITIEDDLSIHAGEVNAESAVTLTIYSVANTNLSQDIVITILPIIPDVITNYTVSFTFNGSLQANTQLTMSATGSNISLNDIVLVGISYDEGITTTFTYTFSTSIPVNSEITYSFTLSYIDTTEDYSAYEGWEPALIVDPILNETHTTSASLGSVTQVVSPLGEGNKKSDYDSVTNKVSMTESLEGHLLDVTALLKKNITVNFTFTGSDGNGNYRIDPDYAEGFAGGYIIDGTYDLDGADSTWFEPTESGKGKLIEQGQEGNYYYSTTYDELRNGYIEFTIYFEYLSEDSGKDWDISDWDYKTEARVFISKYREDNSSIDVEVLANPSDIIPAPSQGGDTGEVDTTDDFYILVFDNDGSLLPNVTTVETGFDCFNNSKTSGVTISSASNLWNQYYMYNSTPGSLKALRSASSNDNWFAFHNGSWGNEVDTNAILDAPTSVENGKIAIYLLVTNSKDINGEYGKAGCWLPTEPITGGWYTNYSSIEEFVAALGNNTWVK